MILKVLDTNKEENSYSYISNNFVSLSYYIRLVLIPWEQPIQGASNLKMWQILARNFGGLGVPCYRLYDNIDNELWSKLETLIVVFTKSLIAPNTTKTIQISILFHLKNTVQWNMQVSLIIMSG